MKVRCELNLAGDWGLLYKLRLQPPVCFVCTCVQAMVSQVSQRLSDITWLAQYEPKVMVFDLHASLHTPVATLCAQLTFMRSLRLAEPERADVALGWLVMTHEVMVALQGLPNWPGVLIIRNCIWPLPVLEYTQLGHCVPTSYTEWRVSCDQAVLESICVGINEHRARLGARPLVVYANIDKVRRVGEHVVLKPW